MGTKKIGSYIDENGVRSLSTGFTEDDVSLSQIINASKTVAISEKQFEEMKKSNKITMIVAIISAAISVLSTLLQLFGLV